MNHRLCTSGTKFPLQFLHGWLNKVESGCWINHPKSPRLREACQVYEKFVNLTFNMAANHPELTLKCYRLSQTLQTSLAWGGIVQLDTLVVSCGTSSDSITAITKRVVRTLVSSMDNPFGLVANCTLQVRLLLKDISWLSEKQWDEQLRDNFGIELELSTFEQFWNFEKLFPTHRGITYVCEQLTWCLSKRNCSSSWTWNQGTATTELAFVIGKARVAVIKSLSIPKLELPAALPPSRLPQELQLAISLKIERCFLWSDSASAIEWLHSPKPSLFLLPAVKHKFSSRRGLNGIMFWRLITL